MFLALWEEVQKLTLASRLYIVFQNWEESSWNRFLLETMQVGIWFTISFIWLLEIPQWECGHPWSTTQQPRTYPKTTNFCVIIEGANKIAGKGQITKSTSDHVTSRGSPSGDVWWRHFQSKDPTRANVTQLPVADAHTQGNPEEVTWPLVIRGDVS